MCFSPAGVRRALGGGHSGEDLLAELADLTRGEIPQALSYLVHDVARQHGRLRAGSTLTYLRCDDAPLLAEVAADRRLRRQGLRLLAPTVLVAEVSLPDLLTALRSAGYSPVEESADGATVLRGPGNRQIEPVAAGTSAAGRGSTAGRTGMASRPAPVDVPALVQQLLKVPDRQRNRIDLGQRFIDVETFNDYAGRHRAEEDEFG